MLSLCFKFFRWVSERYPLCSQLIAEGSIPQFGRPPFCGNCAASEPLC